MINCLFLCLDVETDEACPCAGRPHTTQLRRNRQRIWFEKQLQEVCGAAHRNKGMPMLDLNVDETQYVEDVSC